MGKKKKKNLRQRISLRLQLLVINFEIHICLFLCFRNVDVVLRAGIFPGTQKSFEFGARVVVARTLCTEILLVCHPGLCAPCFCVAPLYRVRFL